MCAPREKKQGSPAKAPGVDGVVRLPSGVLQSRDAMTEAMSSTGLWRGGGVGGKKRMWLPAVRAGGFFVRSAASGAKSLQVLCSAVQCSGGLARRMDAFEARSRGWRSNFVACLSPKAYVLLETSGSKLRFFFAASGQ